MHSSQRKMWTLPTLRAQGINQQRNHLHYNKGTKSSSRSLSLVDRKGSSPYPKASSVHKWLQGFHQARATQMIGGVLSKTPSAIHQPTMKNDHGSIASNITPRVHWTPSPDNHVSISWRAVSPSPPKQKTKMRTDRYLWHETWGRTMVVVRALR